MKILICGARGFVGRRILKGLQAAGHTCILGVRKARPGKDYKDYMEMDFTQDVTIESWLPRLKGVDAVINAIGILRDSKKQPMSAIHGRAPAALFEACARAGVRRVVQISALGVSGAVETRYFRSKGFAEQALIKQASRLEYLILRPSAIFGVEGSSAAIFLLQAKMPIHFLPMGGGQKMQPVHVDDLVQVIANWLGQTAPVSQIVNATGSDVVTMAQMLASYRRQLGRGPAWQIGVPKFLMNFAAWCGDSIPASPLSTENLLMLNAGSTGDNTAFTELLGKPPQSVHAFINPELQS